MYDRPMASQNSELTKSGRVSLLEENLRVIRFLILLIV